MEIERTRDGLVIEASSEVETEHLGRALAGVVRPGVVIGLTGPLGAGKTRLVRALAEALEVDPRAVASPTFVLIHEYEGRLPIHHFDTYRLDSADQFEALGTADYWNAGGICLIEWADRVADLLPSEAWSVSIEPTGPTSRRFLVAIPPEDRAASELAEALLREHEGGVV